VQERTEDGIMHLSDNNVTVSIPQIFGSKAICNGFEIPSAKLWDIIAFFMSKGVKTPRDILIDEAKRSEIYRLAKRGIIVWTTKPEESDVHIKGNVYARRENQRIRPLVDRFNIQIAKIIDGEEAEVLEELFDACATIGFYPVGAVDKRYFFSKDPEQVFKAFGTRSWLKIGVFLKRPGSSYVSIDLTTK